MMQKFLNRCKSHYGEVASYEYMHYGSPHLYCLIGEGKYETDWRDRFDWL